MGSLTLEEIERLVKMDDPAKKQKQEMVYAILQKEELIEKLQTKTDKHRKTAASLLVTCEKYEQIIKTTKSEIESIRIQAKAL